MQATPAAAPGSRAVSVGALQPLLLTSDPQTRRDAAAEAEISTARAAPRRPPATSHAGRAGSGGVDRSHEAACYGHGVYNPRLNECRCTAGWSGRRCDARELRSCNRHGPKAAKDGILNVEALCAGNCDDERGLCYCAGLASPFQRPLPHFCAPAAHRTTRLPDGRPAYPVQRPDGSWRAARMIMEGAPVERGTPQRRGRDWTRPWAKPFHLLYGNLSGNPRDPRMWQDLREGAQPYCVTNASSRARVAIRCEHCYEGRAGRFCEQPKRAFCLRDCNGRGRCDSGFCWCERGWYGIDCGERSDGGADAPRLQDEQGLPSAAATSPVRIYVYDMPSEFTTRNLQYRNGAQTGLARAFNEQNASYFAAGSLYAAEMAMHEWMLDSPLRVREPEKAHLFYVPIYLASLFMWPVVKFADEPYYGRDTGENRRRSHQGALLMLRALSYIRGTYPYWNASKGADHVWMMLHDEGPCFCPAQIRTSILLTHYGYYASPARPWGTYYDDNFLADPGFYSRHLGDPESPTACFSRGKDLVIPPWKVPHFWRKAMRDPELAAEVGATRERPDFLFFAGDLGSRRLKGYSHDLRQRTHALFCNPRETRRQNCTVWVNGCREDIPTTCALWRRGVKITTHTSHYHADLRSHTYCLAFPGDGWSSRVLDAVVHGCIPVVVEDSSQMFLEGAFDAAGLSFDYEAFSVRVPEDAIPTMLSRLDAIPPAKVVEMRRAVLRVRDYFVYKDMYNPDAQDRRVLLREGQQGQDAFLLIALTLEERARRLGKLPADTPTDVARRKRMLDPRIHKLIDDKSVTVEQVF